MQAHAMVCEENKEIKNKLHTVATTHYNLFCSKTDFQRLYKGTSYIHTS